MKYTYLLINILTIFFPLVLSFDKKVAFYKSWKCLFPSILLTALLFITWDVYFTRWGVWGFNDKYITGLRIFALPVEEWLFFFTIPYACVFIYEVIKIYSGRVFLQKEGRVTGLLMALGLLAAGVYYHENLYTSVVFIATAMMLLMQIVIFRSAYLGLFFVAYAVQLVPFVMINGLLTSLPVVVYSPKEIIGLRIWTIPLEDTIYSLMLFLMNISLFEVMKVVIKRGKVVTEIHN